MLGLMATMEIRDKDNSELAPLPGTLKRTGCLHPASAGDLDKCGPDGQPGHSRKKIILALHHQFQEQLKLSQTITDQLNVLAAQATGMEGLLTAALQSLPASKPCKEPKIDSCNGTEKIEAQVKPRSHKSFRMPRQTANVASHSPAPAVLQPSSQRHNNARENLHTSRDNLPSADLINSQDSLGSISACHSNNSDIANNRNDSFNLLHRNDSSSAQQLPVSLSPIGSTASLDSSPLWPAPLYPNGAALPWSPPHHAAPAAMALPCTDSSPNTAAQNTILPSMPALTSRRFDHCPAGNLSWRSCFASEYAARSAGIATFDVQSSGCQNPQIGCGTYGTSGCGVLKAGKSCGGELPPSAASYSAITAMDTLALLEVAVGVVDQERQLSAKVLLAQHELRQRYEQEQLRQLWQQRQLQQQPLEAGTVCAKTDRAVSPRLTSLTAPMELPANHSLGPMQVNTQPLQQSPMNLPRVMESQGSPMPRTQPAALARQLHQAPQVQLRPPEQQQLQPQQQQPPRNRKRRQEHLAPSSSSQVPLLQVSPPTSLTSTPPLMTLSYPTLQLFPVPVPAGTERTPLTSNTSSSSGIMMLSQGTMAPFAPAVPLAARLPHTAEGAGRRESAAAVMAAGVQLAMHASQHDPAVESKMRAGHLLLGNRGLQARPSQLMCGDGMVMRELPGYAAPPTSCLVEALGAMQCMRYVLGEEEVAAEVESLSWELSSSDGVVAGGT